MEEAYLSATHCLIKREGIQSVSRLDRNGLGMCHYACSHGFVKVMKELIQQNQEACLLADRFERTPLEHAILCGNVEMVSFLMSHDAALIPQLISRRVLWAACEANKRDILALVVKRAGGQTINEKDESGSTVLHQSAALGYHHAVELLLRSGADIAAKDVSGATPLVLAIIHGHTSFLPPLVSVQLLNMSDCLGRTPLHWAAAVGNLDAAKLLFKNGANIEARDRKGRTPFLLASFENQASVASYLKQKQAKKDVEDYEGRTA